ncbi:MAG: RNA polymerase sigma factor SigJ [Vicinamibacterales bacterium]
MEPTPARPSSPVDLGRLRRELIGIAYRLVSRVSDAEDLVQEALLRFHQAQLRGDTIAVPRAYLATIVVRLALDHLKSAAVSRERYPGPWLPEPFVDEPAPGQETRAMLDESVSFGFLLLLERLSPVERAVLVLRDVFDFEFDEIAPIVGKTGQNCRQILTRARRHLDGRRRFEASRAKRDGLAAGFFDACRSGDVNRIRDLLAADVVFVGDGGGKAMAAARPVAEPAAVAALLASLFGQASRHRLAFREVPANGQRALLTLDADGRVLNVVTVEVSEDEAVHAVRVVVNPDKLRHLGPVSDLLARRPTGER